MDTHDAMSRESTRSGAPRLRFAVLGPLRAWRGTEPLAMGTPQQRALLAALLLRGGRTATAQELVNALWGDDPPVRALQTLRTYASRIRKALGPQADLLVSEAGGYGLRLPEGEAELDVNVAAHHAAAADKAATAGDLQRARALYNEALSLWNGEPLAGVPGPYAEGHRGRLEEWRLGLLENRLDLDLKVGAHAEAVFELTALTADHPLRERLRELLMIALYRSGRQAEALAVYTDTQRLLAEELGVDPRQELTDLYTRILQGDETLARADQTTSPPETPTRVRPAQLPATVPDFTGREDVVAELGRRLASSDGQVMVVSAVAGIGGVGKTTLAVHVAHAARQHFPDGQLYVDLQGAGTNPAEPVAVLGFFLRALGVPDNEIPEGLEERAALYRSLLDGRRVLTLLDNARDAAQVRPLLPGSRGCAALVTSRARMAGLAGASLVDLDVMSPEEAITLFTRIVGQERANAEREATMDVVAACGFLPLAIRIAASRLAARPTWTVSVLADKLADTRRRLDELTAGDLAVKATFQMGYDQLDHRQARSFRLLGLPDGPDISLPAAAALLDLAENEAEAVLESLVDASLLEPAAPERYRFHDLVRLFARSCAEADETAEEREAALSRLLDFYLATTAEVHALQRPGDRLTHHLEPTERAGLRFSDWDAARNWLFTEAHCLLACVQQSASGPTLRRAVDLLLAAKDLSESGANSRQYELAAHAAQQAAEAAGDAFAEGRVCVALSLVHTFATGDIERADREVRRALDRARVTGDPVANAFALNGRGVIATLRKRYVEAEEFLQRGLVAFRADGDLAGEASALSNLSRVSTALGDAEKAVEQARQCVAILDRLGSALRTANGRYALGIALHAAGRYTEALEELGQALELFRHARQRLWEGSTHARLAEVELAAGRPGNAAAHAEQALALRTTAGDWQRGNVLTLLGRALDALGQRGRARACWQEAVTVFRRLNAPEAEEVEALLNPLPA